MDTLLKRPFLFIPLSLLLLFVLSALLAPFIAPYSYRAVQLEPGVQNLPPSSKHWLGTDSLGRDLFSRLLYGARVSLTVALAVELLDLLVGVTLGMIAGYYGGRWDAWLMRMTDIMLAFPDLLFAVFLVAVVGPGLGSVILALGIVYWPNMARLVRSQVLTLKNLEYIESARALGMSDLRIMFKHLLPNLAGPVLVSATTGTASVILAEATLSFLGIGIQPPYPSWGSMVREGMEVFRAYPLQVIFPALAVALVTLSLNFLGDALRDWLDPRTQRR